MAKSRHGSTPNQIIVAREHVHLVLSVLNRHRVKPSFTRELRSLGLTLVDLPADADLDGVAASLCDSVAQERRSALSPGPDPLDPLLTCLRTWFEDQYSGWAPTMGKNRLLSGVGAPPLAGVHAFDAPAPVPPPADVLPGRPRWRETTEPSPRIVRVGLMDTRIVPHSRLEGAYFADPAGLDVPEPGESVHAWRGHATFVANLVLEKVPSAQLHVKTALEEADGVPAGEWRMTSWRFAEHLEELREAGVEVLSCSLGCTTEDGKPPLVLERAIARLAQDMIVVAAAGNHGSGTLSAEDRRRRGMPEQPSAASFPAALDGVIAVGALDTGGRVAEFTPRSGAGAGGPAPWVDVLAPGVDVVSAYLGDRAGRAVTIPGDGGEPDRTEVFQGWATWSGTSFAAADVSGTVAARLAAHMSPEDARPDHPGTVPAPRAPVPTERARAY